MSAPATTATIVELLRWRATQHPDQLAYTFLHDGTSGAMAHSYRELDRRARTIGAALQGLEAAGSRALLLYPPGLDYLAAFIGCLYAGVVAVPAYPPQLNRPMPRLQAIAHDSQATIALTTTHILHNVESRLETAPELQRMRWFATDQLSDELADQWQRPDLAGDDLAFLQYTSGSTATPKGVMLSHRNLLSNLRLIQQGFGATSDSRGVIWLPPYHDMGLIGGILQPLYSGFPVTLMSPVHFLQRPIRWLQAISDTQASISGGPNFAYELCINKITPEQRERLDLSSWQVAFNGAEPIRAETIERFTAMFAPCGFRREAFYPCYGLAEATLLVSGGAHHAAPIVRTFEAAQLAQNQVVPATGAAQEEERSLVSCGQQLAVSQTIAIVDPATHARCQPDQVGEIWVSGPSIARGYWNQPAATSETFQAQLAETGEGPFLRTGDLGFLHDGALFVTGRLKDLIIIRGRNYYPHDIELTVERSHPALRTNAGAAFSVEVEHEERLVVVQEIDRRHRDVAVDEVAATIRQAVAEEHNLQVYAVALIKTGSMPKTSSGKIQRRACRAQFLANTLDLLGPPVLAPSLTDEAAIAEIEPDSSLDADLRRLVAQVLKLAPVQIDRHSPLTALGLDSLQAVELQHRLETELHVQLPIADLVSGATLAELTTMIQIQLEAGSSPLPPLPTADDATTLVAPLSYGQRALWFVYQVAPASSAYNLANAVRLRQELDVAALREAFHMLAARHPVLRATFSVVDGQPTQQIQQPGTLFFEHEAAAQWSEAELRQRLEAEAERPFDLERGPVLRIYLFTRSAHEHVLLVVAHHIVVDLWSFSVLLKDLDTLYHALTTNTPPALQPLPRSYADYVMQQQALLAGPLGERLWSYWQQQLGGELPTLNLPTDRPRPPIQTYRGATQHGSIAAEVTQGLKALSVRHNATLFTTLLAAFQVLLYRYSGQAEILVGSPSAGRTRADLAGVVGYFVNPLVLRAHCDGNPAFTTLLQQVRQTVLAAFTHQDYPFTLLAERLHPTRDASRSPIFQAMVALQKAPQLHQDGSTALALGEAGATLDLAALHLQAVPLERRAAQFDLSLIMVEIDNRLEARIEYNSDLFEAATISRMLANFQVVLAQIVAAPAQPIATMPLLSAAEQQLMRSWNTSRQAYDAACIHDLFGAQAVRTPDAIAVMAQDQQLSYRELDRAANCLAHYLQALGVGPETVVAIAVERSPDLLIALLGILKAGAAYVPLDPSYPAERIQFMLHDARASVLLTQQTIIDCLPEHHVQVIYLDSDPTIATYPATAPASAATPDNLAYVLYTSGSTGQPKGVQIPHRALVNFLHAMQRAPGITADDTLLALTTIAFDIAGLELFLPLTVGARIVLADRDTAIDGARLAALLHTSGATIMQATPATWRLLLDTGWTGTPGLRALCGGETLPSDLAQTLLSRVDQLWNLYGPTETTIWSAATRVHAADGRISLGPP
ncbi:MAG: AMP-binding protein, partial [Chloroflexi bacterium]|nr:AMP-binding protein [Chloroflexota bacterium]